MSRTFVILLCLLACNGVSSFQYVDLKYEQINDYMNSLVGSFVKISSASQMFNIDPAKDGTLSCSPIIARITDLKSLDADSTRPQMIISGEIHGDERVGPSASLATAQLLVLSSECAVNKNVNSCNELRNMSNVTAAQTNWLAFLATRRDTFVVPTANCLGYMKCQRNDAGVDPNRDFPYSRENNKCMLSTTARIFHHLMRRHLMQLVVTFHSGMVAIGYEWGSKNHMAPRDRSPDDLSNADIGEAMVAFGGAFDKEKLYPVGRINSLVYPVDGGMEDWLYAAGWDKSVLRTDCLGLASGGHLRTGGPQRHLAASGGGGGDSEEAASGGNRALVFLVETSDKKVIRDQTLGQSTDILDNASPFNGHVPRNVRLSLLAMDLLQPYVCLNIVRPNTVAGDRGLQTVSKSENNKQPSPIVNSIPIVNTPHISRHMNSNQSIESDPKGGSVHHLHAKSGGGIHMQWYVGGGASVDHTFLAWHSADGSAAGSKVDTANWTDYLKLLLTARAESVFDRVGNQSTSSTSGKGHDHKSSSANSKQDNVFPVLASSSQSGLSRWRGAAPVGSEHDSTSPSGYSAADPMRPKSYFTAVAHPLFADGTSFQPGRYWLVAWSVMDAKYGSRGQGEPAQSGPQSHYSNARTNPQWSHKAGNRVIQGRRYWPSDPVAVVVSIDGSYVVESAAFHCAHWDRQALGGKIQPTSRVTNSVESPAQNSATAYSLGNRNGDYASNFVTTEQHYLVALLVLGGSVSCCLALLSYWRRNRIYSSLINNKYINVNSVTSGLEQMKILNLIKSPSRSGGISRQ